MKSRSNTMPLKHMDWNPTSMKILTVLLAIYPSLSPTFPTSPTKTMMPLPSTLSCGSQLNRQPVTWLKKTLKCEFVFPDDLCGIKFSGLNGIVECAWKALHILT
ncbi:hypothetical protein VP01_12705g1 [Puccinia sorghi]|uniref:Uncharacterized protein n=1 Tax=Puccinia sorghi TaxID=27349 RepID=A0A0L6VNZ7_9BASI|nr:hypothetical protein VP01_12705g1 [Puccinia sorghi]